MSAWDQNEVKIGFAVRGGASGAASDRPKVLKGKQADAAKRAGVALTTEKKYFTGNVAKGNTDGQRLTRVAKSDEIVKPKQIDMKASRAMLQKRNELGLTQKELATKANTTPTIISQLESGKTIVDNKTFDLLEKALNVKLRGSDIGSPKFGAKKPSPAEKRKAEEEKKAKQAAAEEEKQRKKAAEEEEKKLKKAAEEEERKAQKEAAAKEAAEKEATDEKTEE